MLKENENYQRLNTDIAQQTLKVVDRTFRSFYSLISTVKEGSYHQKVKLPHYLPKDGYFVLILPRVKIKDGCIENRIAKIIVGFNVGLKQEMNIGSRNNQNFVQIPHAGFRSKLKALCSRYGIAYVEQEESYTSQASFLDCDKLPVYNADRPREYKFSGERVKRGLYRTKHGFLVNADCNGAANILRKSKHDVLGGVSRGCLAQPSRVKIS